MTVRVCEECSFDWDLAIDGVLGTLAPFPDGYGTRLDRFLRAPDAGAIRRRPSPEVWSALEYAAHVRDVIDFYADRIDRVLTEERPQMTGADFSSMPERRRTRLERRASARGRLASRSPSRRAPADLVHNASISAAKQRLDGVQHFVDRGIGRRFRRAEFEGAEGVRQIADERLGLRRPGGVVECQRVA